MALLLPSKGVITLSVILELSKREASGESDLLNTTFYFFTDDVTYNNILLFKVT